jgi:hypothetical protein
MKNALTERCKNCHLAGKEFESDGIKFIDCQRDNEASKEHFRKTLKDDNNETIRQEIDLLKCLYQ